MGHAEDITWQLYRERRKHRRFSLRCPVHGTFASEDATSQFDGVTRNVSVGGVLLETTPEISLSSLVNFMLTIRDDSVVHPMCLVGEGQVVRVEVAQDALILSIPGVTIEVARECSSIRSSLMLVVATMVIAQLLLRSPWRKALLVALAVPLSVAKNGLRIFTIAMLGTRVDRGFLNGRLHHQGGIVFFAIALVLVFLLLWLLRRTEDHSAFPLAPIR